MFHRPHARCSTNVFLFPDTHQLEHILMSFIGPDTPLKEPASHSILRTRCSLTPITVAHRKVAALQWFGRCSPRSRRLPHVCGPLAMQGQFLLRTFDPLSQVSCGVDYVPSDHFAERPQPQSRWGIRSPCLRARSSTS
jgi:hypothetical protein